jgi:hypothetical protein
MEVLSGLDAWFLPEPFQSSSSVLSEFFGLFHSFLLPENERGQKNNKGMPNFKSGDVQRTLVENLYGSGLFALAGMPRLVLLILL